MALIIRRWREYAAIAAARTAFSSMSTTFNGVDERVTMGNVFDRDHDQAHSGWIWHKGSTPSGGTLMGKAQQTGDFVGWVFFLLGTGALRFQLRQVGAQLLLEDTVATGFDKPDDWSFFGYSYDGSGAAAGVRLYVDGVTVSSTASADDLTGASTIAGENISYTVGARTLSLFLPGQVDDPGTINRVVTPTEFLELFNSDRPKDPSTLSFAAELTGTFGDTWRAGDSPDSATTWTAFGANPGTLVNMDSSNYTTDVPP